MDKGKRVLHTTQNERLHLARLVCYGMTWLTGAGVTEEDHKDNPEYYRGGAETIANMVACWICQREFGGEVSVPTSDTFEFLRLEPKLGMEVSVIDMALRIEEYIESFVE